MKIIHNINLWCFILNLTLYLMIIPGMIAQFFLGLIQLTLAIIISTKWKELESTIKYLMKLYWSCVAVCGILITLFSMEVFKKNQDAQVISFLFIIPMLIAAYFVYVTWKVSKQIPLKTIEIQENPTDELIIESNTQQNTKIE